MNGSSSTDCTHLLQPLMQQVAVTSFRALSQKAGVSRWQIQQLRQGKIHQMRLDVLTQIAGALEISLVQLLVQFAVTSDGESTESKSEALAAENSQLVASLRQEYARLQKQMEQQAEVLRSQFQTDSLQILESWLKYWPTAAKAAIENEEFKAKNLPPLVKPVEKLIAQWGVVAFETIGADVPYNPQRHRLNRGDANPGDLVRVVHVGYEYQGRLLYRATVNPIATKN